MTEIAVFGGTFDPVHLGHLLMAEQAWEQFDLNKIIFMPAGIPPHKNNSIMAPAAKRYQMLKKAIKNNPHFTVSNYELQKEEKSYTANTLRYLQSKKIADKIYFIIGADSLLDIFSWKEPEFLLSNSYFIVAKRPGFNLKNIWENNQYKPYQDHINIINTIKIDISSSEIRESVMKGKSIKYRTRDCVINYIKKHNLYRGDYN
ncbi:MAG: nicotinate-nucleotide adenylyltransferase [Halothermotrichaceae bacterium]